MSGLDAVKRATWHLHGQAERSGIIAAILAGKARLDGVALLWRNLLPVYSALDETAYARPALVRAEVIRADLAVLAPGRDIPLLPQAVAYADRIAELAGDPALIAHAYVRYLGDLNGGQIMQKRLVVCLGGVAEQLRFHAYPDIADIGAYAASYRDALDTALADATGDRVLQEAVRAFELNIALTQAIGSAVRG